MLSEAWITVRVRVRVRVRADHLLSEAWITVRVRVRVRVRADHLLSEAWLTVIGHRLLSVVLASPKQSKVNTDLFLGRSQNIHLQNWHPTCPWRRGLIPSKVVRSPYSRHMLD